MPSADALHDQPAAAGSRRSLTTLERYGAALALIALATLGRGTFDAWLGARTPFACYFVAVVVAAWIGDFTTGVVCTIGCALAADYFYIDPRFTLAIRPLSGVGPMAVFLAQGVFLSWLVNRWRQADRALATRHHEAQRRAERLEFQATLLDYAYDAVFVRDPDRRITLWNDGARRMYGWTADEAIGRNPHELLGTPPETVDAFTRELEHGAWSGQIRHRHRDGRGVISDSRQVRLASGHVLEVNRDITDKVEAERALLASQQLLHTMLDNFPTVIAFKDRDGRFIDVNPAVERELGRPKEQILGRTIGEFIPREAAARLDAHDQQVMASRQAMQFEEVTPLPHGTLHHLNTNFPLIDADGTVYGTGHISHDITSLKRAQEALKASEQTLKALMDASTESIWMLDRERVLVANITAAERLGLTVDQLVGARWRTLFPEDVANRRAEKVEEVFATGRPVRFEDQRGDIHFDHIFYPAYNATGQVVTAVAAFSRDVTEQRRREDELRDMAQRLAYHVNHSPLAVIEFGPDMRLMRWTGAAERLFGWKAEEVIGKRLDEFRWVYEEDQQQVHSVSTALESGEDPRRFSANRNYRKDGSLVFCEWYNSSLVDEHGGLRSILSLVLDVTDRTRLEQELRTQTQQLVMANRLKDDFLATLSHELRTPINAILGWAQILTMAGFSEERFKRGIDTITRNARLQAQMVEDLLDVSRIVTGSVRLDQQNVELLAVVDQALDAVRPGAEAKALTITADVPAGLRLTADPTRLQQVLWNLLSNAVKFTPPGGHVSVSAQREGTDVQITVTDTGMGIPPAFLPHVFERFRQADSSPTREHGGLGLGLAIVRHIVELHGGSVSVSSEGQGRGATFQVTLPLRSTRESARMPSHGGGITGERALEGTRVFVVEDEPDTREMLATLLSAAGAVVEAVSSASDALARIGAFAPDVLLSDIAMPGTDGYHLIRQLRGSNSSVAIVPAIALTAYGGATARDAALEAGFDRHLAKPVDAEALISAVASMLPRARA